MDVKALYSSIPHSDGIKAGEIFMIKNGFTSMEIRNIIKIRHFILTHSYLEFNDECYVQTHGTAMGKKWPPHMQTYLYGTLKNFHWIIALTNLFNIYVT